jgi:hypothetical protein
MTGILIAGAVILLALVAVAQSQANQREQRIEQLQQDLEYTINMMRENDDRNRESGCAPVLVLIVVVAVALLMLLR